MPVGNLHRRLRTVVCALAAAVFLSGTAARGVIIYGPPGQNLTAPATRALVNSGWQYEGAFGTFTGTPIAANYFITAGHFGGTVGSPFRYNGTDYTTTAFYDDPSSDLRIWKVDGAFGTFAPLYTKKAERGKQVVIFGQGTTRGSEVFVNKQLKGWRWGHLAPEPQLSWGTNTITRFQSAGAGMGDVLTWTFDAKKSATEGALSYADSGGGVFIKDGKTWKLAGINFSVEGPFSQTATPDGTPLTDYANPASNLDDPNGIFNAALFDKGGLYTVDSQGGGLTLNRDLRANLPTSYFATRISPNTVWINSVLAGAVAPDAAAPAPLPTGGIVPEPTITPALLCACGAVLLRRRRRHDAR